MPPNEINDYERAFARRVALELSVKLALESGEVDPLEVIQAAGKFSDFMLDNTR